MNTDYPVGAMMALLNEECILKGFVPLIPYRERLVEKLQKLGCCRKSDCLRLSDDALYQVGLPDMSMINLFRRFLIMYDIDPKKLREIERSGCTAEEVPHLGSCTISQGSGSQERGCITLQDSARWNIWQMLSLRR